jgi:hypothetical protein
MIAKFWLEISVEEVNCVEDRIIRFESVDSIQLFQNTITGMALVNTVIKLPFRNK